MNKLRHLEYKYTNLIKEIYHQRDLFVSEHEYLACLLKYQTHLNLVHKYKLKIILK